MNLREILNHVENCRRFVKPEDWDDFLEQTVYVFAVPGISPAQYEMVGLCGNFLQFGVELIIQPKGNDNENQ